MKRHGEDGLEARVVIYGCKEYSQLDIGLGNGNKAIPSSNICFLLYFTISSLVSAERTFFDYFLLNFRSPDFLLLSSPPLKVASFFNTTFPPPLFCLFERLKRPLRISRMNNKRTNYRKLNSGKRRIFHGNALGS